MKPKGEVNMFFLLLNKDKTLTSQSENSTDMCCFLFPRKFSQGSLSFFIVTLRTYLIQGYFQNIEYYQTFIILDVH